jgi:hypothetical protein
MIEVALAVNGQDCTGLGNTPEEIEAIAATLLRVAQAVREGNHGQIRCLTGDRRTLVSAIVHNRALTRNGDEPEFPLIEELHCTQGRPDRAAAFRNISRPVIDHFRQVSAESQ